MSLMDESKTSPSNLLFFNFLTILGMKKNVMLMLLAMLFFACGSENEPKVDASGESYLQVSDFQEYGELHNAILNNINENLVNPTDEDLTLDKYLDSLSCFNTCFVEETLCGSSNQNELSTNFHRYKNFVRSGIFLEKVIVANTTRSSKSLSLEELNSFFDQEVIDVEEMPSLNEVLEVLHKEKLLSHDGYSILKDFVSSINNVYLGLISDAVFEQQLDELIRRFDELKYDKTSIEGENIGSSLAISKESLKWWKEHPEAYDTDVKVPPVVLWDAAGAIVTAGGSILQGNRPTVGGVVIGAASASLGVVKGVFTFLRGLDKLLAL